MQKEILLIRKALTAQEFYETQDRLKNSSHAKKEKLLVAYNNLLLNLMPEILEQNSVNKKLYLCKMTERLFLLELTLGEINFMLESKSSLDPYSFMPMQIFS